MEVDISDDFEEIRCALSDDKHISEEPIVLTSCSHSVCRGCLIEEDKTEIKCKICGVITDRDLKNDKVSLGLNKIIKTSLNALYNELKDHLNAKISKLKDMIREKHDRIEAQVLYFQEEIDIRIESIKTELEKISEKLKNDLSTIKNDLLNGDVEIEDYGEILKKLELEAGNKLAQTVHRFYEHQSCLIELNHAIYNFDEDEKYKFEFDVPNVDNLTRLVGQFNYSYPKNQVENLLDLDIFNNKAEATIRFNVPQYSKISKAEFIMSSPKVSIHNLEWNIVIKNEKSNNYEFLSYFVECRSEDKKSWKVPVVAELSLLNYEDPEKNFYGRLNCEFNTGGEESHHWGYIKFLEHKHIMDPNCCYYNSGDDSITLEVDLAVDEPVKL